MKIQDISQYPWPDLADLRETDDSGLTRDIRYQASAGSLWIVGPGNARRQCYHRGGGRGARSSVSVQIRAGETAHDALVRVAMAHRKGPSR